MNRAASAGIETRHTPLNTGRQVVEDRLRDDVEMPSGGSGGAFKRRVERAVDLRAVRATGMSAQEEAELAAAEEKEREKRRKVDDAKRAEYLIRDAMAQGKFDNLKYAGKPIPGLGEGYDPDWWVKGLIQRENITGMGRKPSSSAPRTPNSTPGLTPSTPKNRSGSSSRISTTGSSTPGANSRAGRPLSPRPAMLKWKWRAGAKGGRPPPRRPRRRRRPNPSAAGGGASGRDPIREGHADGGAA